MKPRNKAGNAEEEEEMTCYSVLQVTHLYICDYHKNMIQRVRTKRKRKESLDGRVSPDPDEERPEVGDSMKPSVA